MVIGASQLLGVATDKKIVEMVGMKRAAIVSIILKHLHPGSISYLILVIVYPLSCRASPLTSKIVWR